jgi:glycosyltransferase involved in cell wall biosynthesis
MSKTKIFYLYAEIMSYNVAVFREYVNNSNTEVHVLCWDKQKKTPYIAPDIPNVFYYKKSNFDFQKIVDLICEVNPHIIVTSGWMDKLYIKVCKKIRKHKNIPILAVSDTQWYGNLKQFIGQFYFKSFYKSAFTHIWVAGAYQFEYAKRLGFKNNEIVFNFLSADLNLFNHIFNETIKEKEISYPKRFLYAGRFSEEKGLDILIKAWKQIDDKKNWKITIVGNGPLKNEIINHEDIEILDFVQPEEFKNLVKNSGCFVLPSKMEPWALVLHEFAAAGMPIICSDQCGAAPTFVINNYNGYLFESNNIEDLKNKMLKIMHFDDDNLLKMAKISHKIGQRIDPETVAKASLSVLN